MRIYTRASLVVLMMIAAVFGSILTTAAQDTTEQSVNVIGCVDPDCADTVNIFTMEGATVSTYSPEGDFIQSCTVTAAGGDFDGCEVMTVPLATYVVTPGPGYEAYTLFSESPAIFESPDRGVWVWYFVPPAAAPAETIRANVITCVDPDCADTINIETMVGATVSSYAADGSLVDSCTVALTFGGFVDCTLIPPMSGGWYDIQPAAGYEGYVLVSDRPEIFESEMHGPVYVWYFAPEKDNAFPPPTQAPTAPTVVTGLPSTGVGTLATPQLIAVIAVVPFILAAAALAANRIDRR